MRNQLHSDGPGRSFTAASNRTFVHQVVTEHNSRLGVLLQPTENVFEDVQPETRNFGGNPRMTFMNIRLSVYKDEYAPGRSLTYEELDKFTAKANADWAAMGIDEQVRWYHVYTADRAERMLKRRERVTARHADLPSVIDSLPVYRRPVFCRAYSGLPPAAHPFSTHEFRNQRYSIPRASRRKLSFNDPKCFVAAEPRPEARVSKRPPPQDGEGVVGCRAMKRNVCRDTLTVADRTRFNDLLKRWNSVMTKLGAPEVRKSTHLFLLRSVVEHDGDGAEPFDLIAQVCLGRFRPIVQVVFRFGLGPLWQKFRIDHLPVQVEFCSRNSKLSTLYMTGCIESSEDLLLVAAKEWRCSWHIHELDWMRVDGPSLLKLRLLGIQDECLDATPAARVVQTMADLRRTFNAIRPSSAAAVPPADVAPEVAPGVLDEATELDDFLAGEPDLIVEDFGDVVEPFLEPPDPVEEREVVDHEIGSDDEERVWHGTVEKFVPKPPEAVAAMRKSHEGYLRCDVEPWRLYRGGLTGRLVQYPYLMPLEKQRQYVRCFMHPSCSIPNEKRNDSRTQSMYEWLFSMTPPPHGLSDDELHALRDEHQAAWRYKTNKQANKHTRMHKSLQCWYFICGERH